jgi:hypothetical protein
MIKTLGYSIFLFSCLVWGMLLVVPWFGLSKPQLAWVYGALIITGEVTFYLSIALLGKSFIGKIKTKLRFSRSKHRNAVHPGEEVKQ